MEMVRVEANRFVCKVVDQEDEKRINKGHPWQVMNCIVLAKNLSSPTDPKSIVFNRLPLWISFRGLLLEHLSRDSIRTLAAAAGECGTVLPDKDIPDTTNGFRAHVQVPTGKPLSLGTFTNSLDNGIVWIGFHYNNPPGLLCEKCKRLGHEKRSCTFEEQRTFETEILKIGYKGKGKITDEEDEQWPHQLADNRKGPGPETQSSTNNELFCNSASKSWVNMDLIDTTVLSPNISTIPTTLLKPNNNPSSFMPNNASQTPLVIREERTTAAQRR
ncbi:hypothetical protein FRX31_033945 [Thalictrum thalictroides]|uniref:DUF4283 domain-containing protein n=1 Tax=Thalictrum thalictroides TaxID=46969 RepID=A0A7J6UV60_THATH|nr:hypothetical protein FRX31_033945 [Thalictrum thalictroides]